MSLSEVRAHLVMRESSDLTNWVAKMHYAITFECVSPAMLVLPSSRLILSLLLPQKLPAADRV